MKKPIISNKDGTSMIFVLLLFVFMAVLGINLVNAVNANVVNTKKTVEKEQTLLYITSIFEVVNEMIINGAFIDGNGGTLPNSAKTTIVTKDKTDNRMEVEVMFKSTNPLVLTADISMHYQEGDYVISCYYKKAGAGNEYVLERCNGLEGKVE